MINLADIESRTGKEIKAFIFDLDGLLIESEEYWDEARANFVKKHRGRWNEKDQKNVMGLNSHEWANYIKKKFRIPKSREKIVGEVKRLVLALYKKKGIQFITEAVRLLKILSRKRVLPQKKCYSVAIATSSPKEIVEFVLRKSGLDEYISGVVSSDEVKRGKPYPDVYLKTARFLEERPANILVFEDSPNGVLSAKAAGMTVVAVPNKRYNFQKSKFKKADLILRSLNEFKT